ncbi:hypothetical protein FRC11_010346 [Ceratobasidium sp. 423]|nr:hypothetical protein FRC11_010346 [Ceratobasidium sp. 423]
MASDPPVPCQLPVPSPRKKARMEPLASMVSGAVSSKSGSTGQTFASPHTPEPDTGQALPKDTVLSPRLAQNCNKGIETQGRNQHSQGRVVAEQDSRSHGLTLPQIASPNQLSRGTGGSNEAKARGKPSWYRQLGDTLKVVMEFFPNGTHRLGNNRDDEVISISSDEEDEKIDEITMSEEIIQISSDESDSQPLVASSGIPEEKTQLWIQAQYPNHKQATEPLLHCSEYWALGYEFGEHSERDPMWDLEHSPLMSVEVMDPIVAYLTYHRVLMSGPHPGSHPPCLIPPSVFHAMATLEHVDRGLEAWRHEQGAIADDRLQSLRSMVWVGDNLPGRLVIPVIEQHIVHCYIWYGDITPSSDGSKWDVHLKCLDSLSPPNDQEMDRRLKLVKNILAFLLPQLDGLISGSLRTIPNYRQAPGSYDCGYFVCQAVSALVWGEEHSLTDLLPVDLVRQQIKTILSSHMHDHALHRLADGYIHSSPVYLHRRSQKAPPPWLSNKTLTPPEAHARHQRPSWSPPKYERSLSEPGDDRLTGKVSDGWEHIFGPKVSERFKSVDPKAFGGYLQRIRNGEVSMPAGILEGAGGQIPEHFMAGVLLDGSPADDRVPWLPPGIYVVHQGDDEEEVLESPEKGIGIGRFTTSLECLREGEERSKALLTGTHQNVQMHLNWEAGASEPEIEYLSVSFDIDSLSLTVANPEFKEAVVMYPYPPRASTLTTDNGLKCRAFGDVRPLSHVGHNNQFRINVFFPNYYKGKNGANQFITYMTSDDYKRWYNLVMLRALFELPERVQPEYRDAALRLRATLPKSYKSAENLCVHPGGRSFVGFKIMPELINVLLSSCRRIIETTPTLAMFRGFFYHIVGMNLKAIGQAVERNDGNSLLHILTQFPFLDWSMQNPADIAADVGIEFTVDPNKLPLNADNLTLIWRLSALKSLVAAGWRVPQIDAYMHSHVVGGVTCKPKSSIARMFYHFHAYMKEKSITYIHRDRSIGSSFSPADALWGSKRYRREISALEEVLLDCIGSFGVRAEWRCGLWAAMKMLEMSPSLWRTRFLSAGAILAFHTSKIVRYKVVVLSSYDWICQCLQQLPQPQQQEDNVMVLAAALTYLIHGIVSRPDDMSSSRQMASLLKLIERSRKYGFPSIPPDYLAPGFAGIYGEVAHQKFRIIDYMYRKGPAGARVKGSFAPVNDDSDGNDQQEGEQTKPSHSGWNDTDSQWVQHMINGVLAGWFWGHFPAEDKRQDPTPTTFRGPLMIHKWASCVQPYVPHAASKPSHRFDALVDQLLPKNWALLNTDKCWRSLDFSFLRPVRARLEQVSESLRPAYSTRIREEFRRVLKTWEYLPFLQSKRMWVTEGRGRFKAYKLHVNPARVQE